MTKRLYKSTNNKMLCGVCGGIAEYFDLDPTLVRLGWAFLTLFTCAFPGIILYAIAAVIMPQKPAKAHKKDDVVEAEVVDGK